MSLMIDHVRRFTLPAAYALLPGAMASREATALLLAIGLQESGFRYRRQVRGPARGLWQFEAAGLYGVLHHRLTIGLIGEALTALRYPPPGHGRTAAALLPAIEHNDVLAAVFARLLLWTLDDPLPDADQVDEAWAQYRAVWRPGKPHPGTWAGHFAAAWGAVEAAEAGT